MKERVGSRDRAEEEPHASTRRMFPVTVPNTWGAAPLTGFQKRDQGNPGPRPVDPSGEEEEDLGIVGGVQEVGRRLAGVLAQGSIGGSTLPR